jgi:hypothetical protein
LTIKPPLCHSEAAGEEASIQQRIEKITNFRGDLIVSPLVAICPYEPVAFPSYPDALLPATLQQIDESNE